MRFDEFATIFEGYREAQQEFAQGTDADAVKKMINAYRSLVDRNQVQGQERNIDYWRKQGWENFSKFVQSKSQERSSTQVKQAKGIKPQQITLRDDNKWLIVIPLDKDTSCFYGRGTSWCTTKSQERYFEQYFYDNFVTLIYYINKLTGRMWAMAVDYDQGEVECVDQNNNPLSEDDFEYQTRLVPIIWLNQARAAQHIDTIDAHRAPWQAAMDKLNKMDFGQLSPEQKPEVEKLLLFVKDPGLIMLYARQALQGRWPRVESLFIRNAFYAYQYAKGVIQGRWPEAEPVIAKNPKLATRYATVVIKGRWPEAEPVIATQPEYAYDYATNVIKGRWPEAEPAIATNQYWAQKYAQNIIHGPWPEAGIN